MVLATGVFLFALVTSVFVCRTSDDAVSADVVKENGSSARKAHVANRASSGANRSIEGDGEVRIGPSALQLPAGDSVEEELSVAQRELLEELRALSDAEDRKGLFDLIAKIQASNEWPDGIPTAIHEEAIEALAWIGADALPELVGYLGSGDEGIRESALDVLTDMLSDPDKSDYDRSALLKSSLSYLNTVTDTDALDDIFGDIMEMRNSVKADTLLYILEHGSNAVQEALKDTIEMVVDIEVEDCNSVEEIADAIRNWASQEENQDDADDDDFYGVSLEDDGEDLGELDPDYE